MKCQTCSGSGFVWIGHNLLTEKVTKPAKVNMVRAYEPCPRCNTVAYSGCCEGAPQ